MSEQFLVEQLDEVVDAIVAGDGAVALSGAQPELAELTTLASELRLLPREKFKLTLKETLIRSPSMTSAGVETSKTESARRLSIVPYLTVKGAEQLVEFVKQAFGANETFRTTGSAGGMHAEVMVGDSKLMIGGYPDVEEKPAALHLYVPDADAVYKRALEAGAISLEEPVDQFYGDREAGVKDPSGNVWWIATHKLRGEGTYAPAGMGSVTPSIPAVGAAGLIEFLQAAFDAEVVSRDESSAGVIQHATLRLSDSMLEIGEAHGIAQPMPPALYMYVADVDASYDNALRAGATTMQPPTDQAYGDRTAWVQDAWGNIWYLAAPIE